MAATIEKETMARRYWQRMWNTLVILLVLALMAGIALAFAAYPAWAH